MRFAACGLAVAVVVASASLAGLGADDGPTRGEPELRAWIEGDALMLDSIEWLTRYRLSIAVGDPTAYVHLAACPWSSNYAHYIDGWRSGWDPVRWVSLHGVLRLAAGNHGGVWLASGVRSYTTGGIMSSTELYGGWEYALLPWMSVRPQAGALVVLEEEGWDLAGTRLGAAIELEPLRGTRLEVLAEAWRGSWGWEVMLTASARVWVTEPSAWPPSFYRHWTL